MGSLNHIDGSINFGDEYLLLPFKISVPTGHPISVPFILLMLSVCLLIMAILNFVLHFKSLVQCLLLNSESYLVYAFQMK